MGKVIDFLQHVGKQYTYGKGLEELSEVEQLKLENKRKDIVGYFKKYKAALESETTVVIDLVDQLKGNYSIKLILKR